MHELELVLELKKTSYSISIRVKLIHPVTRHETSFSKTLYGWLLMQPNAQYLIVKSKTSRPHIRKSLIII